MQRPTGSAAWRAEVMRPLPAPCLPLPCRLHCLPSPTPLCRPAQVTRHLVSGEAVLWANRNVGLLLFIPLSLIVDGTDWSWVAGLSGEGWGVLIFAGEPGACKAVIFLLFRKWYI